MLDVGIIYVNFKVKKEKRRAAVCLRADFRVFVTCVFRPAGSRF